MKAWGSAAAVIAAVRDDAAVEAERLERAADAALAALRRAAVAASDAPDLAPRVASARRAAAELLADEDWQDMVDAAADRDAWIASIAQQGRRAFATAPEALAWTAALACEAVRQLPGSACVVTVPAGLSPAPDEAWRLALEASTGRQITLERGPFPAGCVARTPDGRVTFDNRLEAREGRMRTRWRAALARIYEAAVADADVLEPA
jgi:vacuolar-type H+-ATPase subunit E/Vma4